MTERCDVVVLGGGLASLCLTRLLLLEHPGIRISTVDVAAAPSRKVGESSVEIAAHFLHTRLQLADLLARSQLPKNGLRFWFDDEHNELPLCEASEDGPITFSYWQSYQLDRERLERDLLEQNRAAGARHYMAVRDVRVETGRDGHRVRCQHDGRTVELVGRWFVDASGFAARWGRSNDLLAPEPRVSRGACWGRFRGFASPDEVLAAAGDRRAVVGRRLLSTNHLMNDGYWIWWIPLASGLMSVGLVYDQTRLERPPRNQDEFVAFLRRHRMCEELMVEAEPVDFGRLENFAWKPRRYFGADRTASIGMAGGFVDPLYSGGSDFIALECECLSRLIADGEPDPARLALYNEMLEAYYEQTVQFVDDTYKTFASYELSVVRYRRDLHAYWNLWVWPYFSGELLEPEFLRRFLPLARRARERGAFFNRLLRGAYGLLAAAGQLRRRNRGGHAFNQLGYGLVPFIRFERQLGHAMDLQRSERLLDEIDAASWLALADAVHGGAGSPQRGLLFDGARDLLGELVALERELGAGSAFWRAALARLGPALRARLAAAGADCGVLEIGPESWCRVQDVVLAALGEDAETVRAGRRSLRALPALEAIELPPAGDAVQPRTAWPSVHRGWPLHDLDTTTVYDWMARRPTSEITRLYR